MSRDIVQKKPTCQPVKQPIQALLIGGSTRPFSEGRRPAWHAADIAAPAPFGYLEQQPPVAQLDRALPSEGRGHKFKSCRARQISMTSGTLLGTASSRGSTTEARDGAKLDGLSRRWRHQLESATKRASGAWADAIVRRLAHSRIVVKNRWGAFRATVRHGDVLRAGALRPTAGSKSRARFVQGRTAMELKEVV